MPAGGARTYAHAHAVIVEEVAPATVHPTRRSRPAPCTALNPTLRSLLAHCGFDRTWVSGQGTTLIDAAGRPFLDFYAQFGAVVLGHNAPPLVAAMRQSLATCEPAMVQPYRARHAEALADRLAQVTGMARCTFTTSGAETVEAAIKLVRARTDRPLILSAEGSFHGKTMGALAATGQRRHAAGFGQRPAGFVHVPFGDVDALADRLVRDGDRIAAFFVEPIQGERGVHPPPPGYLRRARELCSRYGVALVCDEIQTGLGRTGRLLASEHEGVRPDVVLLAKALGGGLFPLGALLCTAELWSERFALGHSSTFANNNLACRVGLAVVGALLEQGLLEQVEASGLHLGARLAAVAAAHPTVIIESRGLGLLRAVELSTQPATGRSTGSFLSYFAERGLTAYAVAAAIAERSGVLVLPTQGESAVLRFTPPLVATRAEIDRAADALDDVCRLLERDDAASLARAMGATSASHRPVIGAEPASVALPPPPSLSPAPSLAPVRPSVAVGRRGRFAFLIHYTSRQDVISSDPSLAALSADELDHFCAFSAALPPGVVVRAAPMRSLAPCPPGASPAEADGFLIALGMLPEEMARRGRHRVQAAIVEAVDLAASLGADVVGLGGYTTPYSRRGLAVTGRGPAITTGNTLTAVMAFEALRTVAASQGRPFAESSLAVVGARGSVGALLARLAARAGPRQLVLVGNPVSGRAQLDRLAEELRQLGAATRVEVAPDLSADPSRLARCDLILTATGARRPALDGVPIASGTIVCDVARPFDAPPSLRARADVTVIDGGLVALPDPHARFGPGNLCGLPDGVQLACLSETILLALSGEPADHGLGDDIPLAAADRIAALAHLHGFRLAAPMRDGRLLVPSDGPRGRVEEVRP